MNIFNWDLSLLMSLCFSFNKNIILQVPPPQPGHLLLSPLNSDTGGKEHRLALFEQHEGRAVNPRSELQTSTHHKHAQMQADSVCGLTLHQSSAQESTHNANGYCHLTLITKGSIT